MTVQQLNCFDWPIALPRCYCHQQTRSISIQGIVQTVFQTSYTCTAPLLYITTLVLHVMARNLRGDQQLCRQGLNSTPSQCNNPYHILHTQNPKPC